MIDLDGLLHNVTKPARYTGGEWNSVAKDWDSTDIRIALSYPDIYEIGMCNLGLAIIYDLLNEQPDVLAERVFVPWVDMEDKLRREGIPLFSLESRMPVKDFDILGFSLGYELTYSNVLNLLDLAQIPVLSAERRDSLPLIIAGGGCSLNPEPIADFIDLFIVGEGEEVVREFIELFRRWKREGSGQKRGLLREAAKIPGVYVPGFYEVDYRSDGTIASIVSTAVEAAPVIVRRVVNELPAPLTRPIVPFLEVVHDRGAVEIQRGCFQGCRFCQAGIVYRPVRERGEDEVVKAVEELVRNCGYETISLLSLSSSDYGGIASVLRTLAKKYAGSKLSITMPSLRLDSFSVTLADLLQGGKKAGFTFAPEAGTERLRRVINKNVAEEDILHALETAWDRGWKSIKLYFMIGLPTETLADVEGIVHLLRRIRSIGNGRLNVKVNVSTFVPKPHTPFQWVSQASEEDLIEKQDLLRAGLKRLGIHMSWHDPRVSLLEGVLSRGDRRLAKVIHNAWRMGCKFDAWSEHYDWEKWQNAFHTCGLDPLFYARRERPLDELLPWYHIDTGVDQGFLRQEYERARLERGTSNCRDGPCNMCGLQKSQEICRRKYKETAVISQVDAL